MSGMNSYTRHQRKHISRFEPQRARLTILGLVGLAACFAPSEGYYDIHFSDHMVRDTEFDESITGEQGPCPDELSDLFGMWVTDSGHNSFNFVVPYDCNLPGYDLGEGQTISCELARHEFTCRFVEEYDACYDTSDTGRPMGPYDTNDPTTISRGAALRGRWTSGKHFEAQWSAWKIDDRTSESPCDHGPVVDEWANVGLIYGDLYEN